MAFYNLLPHFKSYFESIPITKDIISLQAKEGLGLHQVSISNTKTLQRPYIFFQTMAHLFTTHPSNVKHI